jgi:hypothetical protein
MRDSPIQRRVADGSRFRLALFIPDPSLHIFISLTHHRDEQAGHTDFEATLEKGIEELRGRRQKGLVDFELGVPTFDREVAAFANVELGLWRKGPSRCHDG